VRLGQSQSDEASAAAQTAALFSAGGRANYKEKKSPQGTFLAGTKIFDFFAIFFYFFSERAWSNLQNKQLSQPGRPGRGEGRAIEICKNGLDDAPERAERVNVQPGHRLAAHIASQRGLCSEEYAAVISECCKTDRSANTARGSAERDRTQRTAWKKTEKQREHVCDR
jgi:hypothetical protein